jgi:CRP-like cAMP-binding protein
MYYISDMNSECKLCNSKSKALLTLSEEEVEKLSANCALVILHKGEPLIKQGTFSTNVVYLRSGLAKIHISGPYHEQIVRIVKAPSFLALPTTFGDKINQYSVTAIEDAEVCFIDISTFRHLLAGNPDFSYEIMIELCRNELENFYRCANRTQKHIRGKMADVLLEMSDRIYKSDSFIVPVSQEEIGNLIDSSRESVSRVLKEFEKDGIVRIKGRKVEVISKKRLKMISSKG